MSKSRGILSRVQNACRGALCGRTRKANSKSTVPIRYAARTRAASVERAKQKRNAKIAEATRILEAYRITDNAAHPKEAEFRRLLRIVEAMEARNEADRKEQARQ